LQVGYKRTIEENDIWTVNPNRSAELMTKKVQDSFKKRLARGDRYPLLWALHEAFHFEFWLGGMCALLSQVFQVISPFTLRYLISFASEAYVSQVEGTPGPSIGKGLGLVFGITIMQLCQSLGTNHFIYRGFMVGGQSRAVLISILFEKSMVISGRAKAGGRAFSDATEEENTHDDQTKKGSKKPSKKQGPKTIPDTAPGVAGDGTGWSNGRVVNLMSVDASRIDQASGMFHLGWTAPVTCLITLVLLIINLTYSALAGFALLVIGLPLLTRAVKSLFVRRRAINKVTDQRVSLTQEILQAVRFVKYFGWVRTDPKSRGARHPNPSGYSKRYQCRLDVAAYLRIYAGIHHLLSHKPCLKPGLRILIACLVQLPPNASQFVAYGYWTGH
jgi:ATP-binding cassette subfamily C (CFTR/MRP) protein 1